MEAVQVKKFKRARKAQLTVAIYNLGDLLTPNLSLFAAVEAKAQSTKSTVLGNDGVARLFRASESAEGKNEMFR